MNKGKRRLGDDSMARRARKASKSGIYHVMIRGINRQTIFEDGKDEEKYLELLRSYRKRCGFALYGYCLMRNHAHLLIKEAAHLSVLSVNGSDIEIGPGEPLENVFKRIGVSYVTYFNRKYKRVGHLFQDRYRSEPVESDAYLLMALRYIHRNPIKAGICEKPEGYGASSYHEYINGNEETLTETDFVLGMITKEQLIEYTAQANDDRFLDMEQAEDRPMTDEEARAAMLQLTGCSSAAEFQTLKKAEKDECFRKIRQEGINISQIGRITGYSRQVI